MRHCCTAVYSILDEQACFSERAFWASTNIYHYTHWPCCISVYFLQQANIVLCNKVDWLVFILDHKTRVAHQKGVWLGYLCYHMLKEKAFTRLDCSIHIQSNAGVETCFWIKSAVSLGFCNVKALKDLLIQTIQTSIYFRTLSELHFEETHTCKTTDEVYFQFEGISETISIIPFQI